MNGREKRIVSRMIQIYCRSHHNCQNRQLCNECSLLNDYAHDRLERCPYGEDKPSCRSCPIHCYREDMRQQIRAVMRFSGPHMLYIYPIEAIKQLFGK